jgi:hypothetical protein
MNVVIDAVTGEELEVLTKAAPVFVIRLKHFLS